MGHGYGLKNDTFLSVPGPEADDPSTGFDIWSICSQIFNLKDSKLHGKPKLVLVQACRSDRKSKSVVATNYSSFVRKFCNPKTSNLNVIYGYLSFPAMKNELVSDADVSPVEETVLLHAPAGGEQTTSAVQQNHSNPANEDDTPSANTNTLQCYQFLEDYLFVFASQPGKHLDPAW